jgi:hypothetical protein
MSPTARDSKKAFRRSAEGEPSGALGFAGFDTAGDLRVPGRPPRMFRAIFGIRIGFGWYVLSRGTLALLERIRFGHDLSANPSSVAIRSRPKRFSLSNVSPSKAISLLTVVCSIADRNLAIKRSKGQ